MFLNIIYFLFNVVAKDTIYVRFVVSECVTRNKTFDSVKTSHVLCGRISGLAICRSSYCHGKALLINSK